MPYLQIRRWRARRILFRARMIVSYEAVDFAFKTKISISYFVLASFVDDRRIYRVRFLVYASL